MTFEEQLREEFADDTAYERLVLATVIDPSKPPPGAVFATNDIRGSGPRIFERGVHESMSSGAIESFAARFRPLAFGAAYKILDFIVEMTMRLNGEPSTRGRWTFVEKIAFIRRGLPHRLPVPLATATPYWNRTVNLYAALDQHRHAVVHRRTRVGINGDLAGTNAAGAPLPPISIAEQDALSRYATSLADSLIEATASKRRLNAMAWDLDALDSQHGCGLIGATQPPAIVLKVIDDLQPGESSNWILDGHRLHTHLREHHVLPIDADVELHAIVGGRDVVYEAHLDDVPESPINVDLASLPRWLRSV
jgi:hypothetical protein